MSAQSEIGTRGDRVTITLGGSEVVDTENYEVATAILTQPAAFSLRLGTGLTVAELRAKYPPNTPFVLRIGDRVVQTGRTDGFDVTTDAGGTSITLHGRDTLAPLHDAYVLAEKSFKGLTYTQLVKEALSSTGLGGVALASDDVANQTAITGGKAGAVTRKPADGGVKPIGHEVFVRVGERWYDFVQRHISRAGLFLWAAADGTFVLTAPSKTKAATYRVTRRRGQTREDVNVVRAHYRNDVSRRYTHCTIYGRGGGRKFGVAKPFGAWVDTQMRDEYGLGESKPLVLRDVDAKDKETADYHARRRLAEAARAGWALGYSFAGHKAPALAGGMAVWTPNTLCEVDDEEFGIRGTYWVESVTYRRDPATTTEVVLMDKDHLIFGTDGFDE